MSTPVDAAPSMTASRPALLLVEDDPDQAFLVRRRLREGLLPGTEVVHLTTVAAATRRLADDDVCCVVLDLSLPDARGLEALHAVRAARPTVPVVVLTGNDSDELGREAVRAGAQDYLVKGRHGADALGRSVVFALERAKRQAAEQRQSQLASRLSLVLDASAEGICQVDERGVLRFLNRAAAQLLGASAEDLVGRLLDDFHVCPVTPCRLTDLLASGEPAEAGEQWFRATGGEVRVLEARARPVGEGVDGWVVNLNDVTERRRAQDALAEREAQLVDAQRLARMGSWEWDLSSGEVVWSEEMHRITGLPREQVPRDRGAFRAYLGLVPVPERQELAVLFDGWSGGRPEAVVVHRLVRPDGTVRWLQCRSSVTRQAGPPADGPRTRVVGTVQDVTEQKVAEDALAHQALHDALTGLPNRALLLDRLERALADSRRTGVAVVFMDLDRFKWVNDSLSHAAGDALLVAVARRLGAALRPTDTLARLGGDEFVLLCPELRSEEQLFDVVARLAQELERPFSLDGHEVAVTTSMGIALAPAGRSADPESLIRDADTALYRAKENGRSRWEVFDDAMRQRASQRLEVINDLRHALQHDELHAWYQPVVDMRTGAVVGCEALVRWQHPTRGIVPPDAFIPHAEETGAIVALGGLVLTQACGRVAAWNRERPRSQALTVGVNLSARQLGSAQLVDRVREALDVSGLSPAHLCLEITESVIMEDVTLSGAVLGQLRALGVRTAVDDFGTGYSSLSYLLSLPLDLLKIDRSFVSTLRSDDGPAAAIVRAITALADSLGMGVLAEGVETPEQRALLVGLGVHQAQGFLWGAAVPAEDAGWAAATAPLPALVPPARRPAAPSYKGARP